MRPAAAFRPSVVLVALSAAVIALAAPVAALAQDAVIAYEVPAGAAGNQDFGGTVGMDFDLDLDVLVTHLGVFDSGSDGLTVPLSARLYDRDTLEVIAALDFTPGDPGELLGGSRFKALAAPIDLPAGFHGVIAASGYAATELLANGGAIPIVWTTNGGACALRYVGSGRFDAGPAAFPGTVDGGPANRYAAGTFIFESQEEGPPPRGGIAYAAPDFTFGNQTFAGTLGMDFDTRVDIDVTRLGVFDSGSDGLQVPLTARLFDRDSMVELARIEFAPGEDGELAGGHRLLALSTPLELPAGFRGVIAAEGYSDVEQNGNQSVFDLALTMDSGNCAIQFVGRGRTSPAPGVFPAMPAAGVANVFAAGTFEFELADTPFVRPQPPTALRSSAESGRITLSWTAPAGGPPVAGYNVYRTSPGTRARVNPVLVTATSFAITGLLDGIEQCFVVRSALASGIEGADSEEICDTPPVEGVPDVTTLALAIDAGAAGNQPFTGALGIDFDVNAPLAVLRLGVFDDLSDGLTRTLTARLWDRSTQAEVATLVFSPDDPGELAGGYRLKALPSPIALPIGFRGTIAGEGFGDTERAGNRTVGPIPLRADDLDCAIAFVGSRFGGAGGFPPTFNGGPRPELFAAGTFEYGPVGAPAPRQPGGIAYVIDEGVAGNQDYGGALGMEFDVEADIEITRLGVFDDLSDGLFLPINARIYDRDTLEVIAAIDFTPEDPGDLEGGSRFKELEDPLGLPAGFRATMVASGYGAGERNGNQGAAPIPGMSTDHGGCLIAFVGVSRYGPAGDPLGYPVTIDAGPSNRYAAGTFEFRPAESPVVLPPGPPTAIAAEAGATDVLLTWQAPASATPAARYRILRAPAGGGFAEIAVVDTTTHRDSGLASGVEVCYRLRAVAASGEESRDTDPVCVTTDARVPGRVIAYPAPGGVPGTVDGAGEAFGLDFDVALDVRVARLGVFDDGTNGLAGDLVVKLFDRDTQEQLGIVELSAADPGVLIGGHRFKDLPGPIDLLAGFHGSVVAEGFSAADRVRVVANLPTDAGPCSLRFPGARRDLAGQFPILVTPGAHPFAAGSFEFEPLELAEPRAGGIAYGVPEGTFGNQVYGGALGMDFDVRGPIRVTRLGVFDDAQDGLFLPINARLYDRDTLAVLASTDFTPEDPGELIDGSRFKDLPAPLRLPAGLRGTMVASGYGDTERNGNQGAFDLGLTTDDGGCLVVFVGGARFSPAGADPLSYPTVVDGGPANRYAAGTFVYERDSAPPDGVPFVRGDTNADSQVNLSDGVFVLNFLFLGGEDPQCDAAMDVNADGQVNLSDGVSVLNFLFLGGADIPPPNVCTVVEGAVCARFDGCP